MTILVIFVIFVIFVILKFRIVADKKLHEQAV